MKRNKISSEALSLIQNEEWLRRKIEQEGYSCSRLAKEYGTTRTTVEKYRILYNISQNLSQKELTAKNYSNKTKEQKQLILEKRKTTNQQKFGVDNTFQSEEKKQKIKETMVEKYGVEKALQNPEILEKQQQTMIDKFDTKFAMNNEEIKQKVLQMMKEKYGSNPFGNFLIQEKIKETNLAKYGVEHPMSNPDIAKYAKQRFLENNTYEDIQQKIKETNLAKYGVEYAKQSHMIEALPKLYDKEWLIEQHHNQKKTLSQIGNELGCNMTTIARYMNLANVEIKYYYESAQQRELSDWLSSLNIQVLTNNRTVIKPHELDIYLPEYNLAIEYCGVFWHSDFHERMTPSYHKNKMTVCNASGIRLLTIFEDEWVYKKDIVKQKIINILGKDAKSVYARKCKIISVTNSKIKNTFFDTNHIQGSGPGSITYGLTYENNIVAMMTFIKKPNGVYDLNRYASSIRVVGGFQKLLKHFQNSVDDWKEILSFADLRWSQGNMYQRSGFKLDKILPVDYKYVIGNKTYHKFAFRRKALETFLPNFIPSLSEQQNMKLAGYYKIFNCGLMRFVMFKE